MGYKVTKPSAGVWHYEYALDNINLDRAIQSFSVPLALELAQVTLGFTRRLSILAVRMMAPKEMLGTAAPRGMLPRTQTLSLGARKRLRPIRTRMRFAGHTLSFRFDADQPPHPINATVGFFKTGSPMGVLVQAPSGGVLTPTPTPPASPTPTPTPSATPSPTATPPATATPTSTVRPTPTPRPNPPQGLSYSASAPVNRPGITVR